MKRAGILLTPGPTPLPPEVRAAMGASILHHRTEEFGRLFEYVITAMQGVYRSKNSVVMMTCSGTGGMEASVCNLLSAGDAALVHAAGAFGERYAAIAKAYGVDTQLIAENWGEPAEPEKLRAALKAKPGVKAVFLTHTDTSTGVLNDVAALAKIVRAESDALVVVDSISGLAAERLDADAWGLDVVVTGSQKGLMNAPGLAFACVSARAWKAAEQARLPRFYFDWRAMRKSLPDRETPYTPAVSLVAGQAAALKLIAAEGLENVWARTARLSDYARAWAEKMGLALFSRAPAHILTALRLPDGLDGSALIASILKEDGVSIAGGQLHLKGKIIRIAHMGFITRADLDAGFSCLEKRLSPARR